MWQELYLFSIFLKITFNLCQFTARDQRRRPLLLWLCRLRIWLRRLRQRQQQHQQQQQPSQQQQHEAAPSPIEKRPILRRLALLRGRGGLLASASPSAAHGGNDHDAQGKAAAATAAATCAQERRCCAEETGETEFKAKKNRKKLTRYFSNLWFEKVQEKLFWPRKTFTAPTFDRRDFTTNIISQFRFFQSFMPPRNLAGGGFVRPNPMNLVRASGLSPGGGAPGGGPGGGPPRRRQPTPPDSFFR